MENKEYTKNDVIEFINSIGLNLSESLLENNSPNLICDIYIRILVFMKLGNEEEFKNFEPSENILNPNFYPKLLPKLKVFRILKKLFLDFHAPERITFHEISFPQKEKALEIIIRLMKINDFLDQRKKKYYQDCSELDNANKKLTQVSDILNNKKDEINNYRKYFEENGSQIKSLKAEVEGYELKNQENIKNIQMLQNINVENTGKIEKTKEMIQSNLKQLENQKEILNYKTQQIVLDPQTLLEQIEQFKNSLSTQKKNLEELNGQNLIKEKIKKYFKETLDECEKYENVEKNFDNLKNNILDAKKKNEDEIVNNNKLKNDLAEIIRKKEEFQKSNEEEKKKYLDEEKKIDEELADINSKYTQSEVFIKDLKNSILRKQNNCKIRSSCIEDIKKQILKIDETDKRLINIYKNKVKEISTLGEGLLKDIKESLNDYTKKSSVGIVINEK